MKKHNLKKNITRILACALLIATLGLSLASCSAGDKVKDTAGKVWDTAVDGAERIYETVKDKITMEQTDDFGQISLLSLASGAETVDEQDVMYQVIKATVLPESATDQSTTWEVYWIDNQTGNEDAEVTDYVTVMACIGDQPYTAQPGSNYCKVTCKQAFAGSTIGVRVTTVVGGFTAQCKVTYVGVPSRINAYFTNADGEEILLPGFVAESSAYKPALPVGSTSDFRLAMDNVFHNVGADYGNYKVASVSMTGIINVRHYTYSMGDVTEGDISQIYLAAEDVNQFITASIEGDTLHINVKATYENFMFNLNGGYSGSYDKYVSNCGEAPYFIVTVEDQVSGKQGVVRFNIYSSVTNVALSDSNLVF